MRSLIFIILFFYSLILYLGCANQVIPSGGEKDIQPPQPMAYFPENNSTFFNTHEIVVLFDEYFQATDIFNQIVISPPLDTLPEIKVKGKKLIIKLKSSLRDSTTYTINFGESIKDITENNVLENFTYVFSTGSFIDSLSIMGSVYDMVLGKQAAKIYVVLYPSEVDSAFLSSKPYYFAKTNENGRFTFNNLKEGTYQVYAIEDQNFNFYYDLPNEKIAFLDSIISLDSLIGNINLNLFLENNLPQKILSAKSVRYAQSKIVFAKNTDSVNINFHEGEYASGYFEKNKSGDTITYWSNDIYLDKHIFHIQFDTIDTILSINVKAFSKDSVFTKNKNSFTTNVASLKKGVSDEKQPISCDLNKKIEFNFLNPIDTIYSDVIAIYEDSSTLAIIPFVEIDSTNKNKLSIIYNWKPSTVYAIHLKQNGTRDIFGLGNDSARIYIKTKKIEDYGTITFNIINTFSSPLIIQFMKSDFTIMDERKISRSNNEQINFKYLLPNKYLVRAIVDENNNGIWDTGNLMEKKQPEKIIYFNTELSTKANWDVELKWEVK